MSDVKLLFRFVMGLGVALLATIALLGVVYVQQQNQNAYVCRKTNVVQTELFGIVKRSARSIGTVAYYREHPAELARAKRQIAEELKTFAPLKC